MATITLARNAMATRFELVLHGDNPVALRSAGEEALAEIDRLEDQLSLYRPTSEIAHVNARAAKAPVMVTPEVFQLLAWAKRLTAETGGAFDITVGPLVRCWGFMGGHGHPANEAELAQARECVGIHLVELDAKERTVRFARPGVMIDLGAIGKGYALEKAVELLREAGVASALVHGGTSTAYAIGSPPGHDRWTIAIERPPETAAEASAVISTVALKDEALSVSARWGRQFEESGVKYGHVLDPKTGRPASRAVLAAVVLPSATETDALSTALLTVGPEGHDAISQLRPAMRSLVLYAEGTGFASSGRGVDCVWGQKPV